MPFLSLLCVDDDKPPSHPPTATLSPSPRSDYYRTITPEAKDISTHFVLDPTVLILFALLCSSPNILRFRREFPPFVFQL